jgi:hydrogenase-4 component B
MGFLGMARTDAAATAREAPSGMRAAMALLAVICIGAGVLPTYVIPVLDRAVVVPIVHESAVAALVPPFFTVGAEGGAGLSQAFVSEFHDLGAQTGRDLLPGQGLVVLHRGGERNPVVFAMSTSYTLVGLAVLLALIFATFRFVARRQAVSQGTVWDGGLRRLSPEFTYTATGFANPVRVIFRAVLQPKSAEDSVDAVAQHFRVAIRRTVSEAHVVDRVILWPSIQGLRWLAGVVRRMHVGNVNAYAGYLFIMLLVVLTVGVGWDAIIALLRRGL